MTRNEFIRKRRELPRESSRLDWPAAAVLVLVGILNYFIVVHLEHETFAPYLIGTHLALAVAALVYFSKWARRTGLLCHSCKRPLLAHAADLALQTGTCPNCRKPAFGPAA